jgi:hypothetical protein
LFTRAREDDSDFLPAGVGAVTVIIVVLATLWLFASAEMRPPEEPAPPPAETDLIVQGKGFACMVQAYDV